MGGKSRLAKSIRDVTLSRVSDTNVTYWEPFVGGCGSFDVIAPSIPTARGSDLNPDLIQMWSALIQGWEPPTSVSPEWYKELRDSDPSPERGFVGFGASFGGKWFGGYAKGGKTSKGEPRNHAGESARNVLKTRERLSGIDVQFTLGTYTDIRPSPGDVVYCDPPYRGTTEYKDSGFDSDKFFAWAEELSRNGVHVFVSEYSAPEGWVEVYRKTLLSSVGLAGSRKAAEDRLFVFNGVI